MYPTWFHAPEAKVRGALLKGMCRNTRYHSCVWLVSIVRDRTASSLDEPVYN